MADLLHPKYLPFTADQLREHFAPVGGTGEKDRHLTYYRASVDQAKKYAELIRCGNKPTSAQTRLGRQMEKDERFWLATALMNLYHADGDSTRVEAFARLLERAGLHPRSGFPRWEDALAGPLELFFEVHLPSPRRYRGWLRDHLDERTPIPYLKEKAAAPRSRLEGQTKADAILLSRHTGVAVIFEAKVLSDISTHVTFDVARNQLARTIDVMLEENSKLRPPLSLRKPEQTFLVLLTPALMQAQRTGDAISKSRLYGWLMPAYRDPTAHCSASTYPTATATNWPKLPNDWGGRAGKIARPWLQAPARGSQPGRTLGEDAISHEPTEPALARPHCGRCG